MADLTPDRLQELRRIAAETTPGTYEWRIVETFLALTIETALVLLDRIEALEAENERLQQKVQRANALAVAVEQVLKAWSMGDYLTPFMDDLRNALLDFEGPVESEDGWLEVATDGEEGGASDV